MPYPAEREAILQKLDRLYLREMDFAELAMDVFKFQARYNKVYQKYLQYIGCEPESITSSHNIPHLPIQLFKSNEIKTGSWNEETIFRSSGTTSMIKSQHYVHSISRYHHNARFCFEQFIGPVEDFCYLALLPGYLERKDSSLVSMVDNFIKHSKYAESGFYLDDHKKLHKQILVNIERSIPTILFGVSFALIQFADTFPLPSNELIIMETGGMKSTSTELSKGEMYSRIKKNLNSSNIWSEYGMTELLSQAYAIEENVFACPSTMRAYATELNDPLHRTPIGVRGQLNIVDLANVDTVAFIQTEDIGIQLSQDTFEINGRLDISDLRGCNLLLEST